MVSWWCCGAVVLCWCGVVVRWRDGRRLRRRRRRRS